ncbi:hypothetical protein Vadar_003586 [Vaccinium darrowii]|uniref:Uncharacterized protein n=1 Tax=Vaccinium darrowii TaxID=229202 RepID=A0ACB7XY17_9ERIC|nr:hypothetical protein Vadar_003586 [Vaccinium darrowii]
MGIGRIIIKGALKGGVPWIANNYGSLEEVTKALANAGLESSNLILGIDFTKSNEWTGKKSYNGRSLHSIGESLNPYEQAISIMGRTLAAIHEDNLIPCYGFGDASTNDQEVFILSPDEKVCNGFKKVLSCYREIVPHLRLAGPTSFAPVIEMAMNIVEQSGGQYHVLVIIADGQVTRSVDTEHGQLSPQERRTVEAIVQASKFPLSIILVGVGDGPWGMTEEFYDNITARAFDNFQFVNFTEIMSKNVPHSRKEIEFALSALMGVPSQYKETKQLNILRGRKGNAPERVPLPPPIYGAASSFPECSPSSIGWIAPPVTNTTFDDQVCPICLCNPRDMAFGCGHQTCCTCGIKVDICPICRSRIQTRICKESGWKGNVSERVPLPPPVYGAASFSGSKPSRSPSFLESSPYPYGLSSPFGTAPPVTNSTFENQVCLICLTNPKDMAFGCGHQTCCDCGQDLQVCPLCRAQILLRALNLDTEDWQLDALD